MGTLSLMRSSCNGADVTNVNSKEGGENERVS